MGETTSWLARQLGLAPPHGVRPGYDSILRRLYVHQNDAFLGVQGPAEADGVPEPPIFACRFAEEPAYRHVVALANEDGVVAVQDTSRVASCARDSPLVGYQCHTNVVFDVAWMPGDMKFVTVSGDHSACLWDLAGDSVPKRMLLFSSHTRSVKTAVFRPSDPSVFATGARDGHILVWDIRTSTSYPSIVVKPDNLLLNCHSPFYPKTPGSRRQPRLSNNITGLVFQDDFNLISSGENDGNIKVWDLRKNYNIYKKDPLPKHSIPYCGSSTKNGYTNLIIDDTRMRLYASGMDSVIYCFNISTYNTLPEQRYVGHESGTFYIKTSLSPDCKYLVSGSSDKNAYIWNVKCSEPVVKLVGHTAEVTCAVWCQQGETKIVTCSDDARHKIWRIGKEYLDQDEEIDLRGRAETVPRVEVSRFTQALDKTPKSLKRQQQNITPGSYGAKRPRHSFDGGTNMKKTKRCLTDMLNASKLDHKDEGVIAKKLKCVDSACAENENQVPNHLPSGSKRMASQECDAGPLTKKTYMESACPSLATTSTWTYISPKKVGGGDSFMTPTKCYERTSPKLISPKRSPRVGSFESPTMNLPNFVLDGEAPHLRLMSPIKKKPEIPNWLALMVKEKKDKMFVDPGDKIATPQPPLSPKPENLTTRRHSASSERTPKRNSQRTTLLKYFNVVAEK